MLVLVGHDGSTGADAAVDAAARLFPGQRLVVLTVWQSPRAAAPAGLLALPAGVVQSAVQTVERTAEESARKLADQVAARMSLEGIAVDVLTARAGPNVWSTIDHVGQEHDAAVIVVGSRGRSELSSVLLGSVAHGLVHHSGRPVLVVPQPT